MSRIVFKAAYGDQDKVVELSSPSGAGSHYHVYIGGFYYGAIIFVRDKWTTALNPKGDEELTTEDRCILVDKVSMIP